MNDETKDAQIPTGPAGGRLDVPHADTRLPYEAPRVRSGPAFEKVVLASGCVEDQAFCIPPC